MFENLENFRVFLLFNADGFNEYSYVGLTTDKEAAYNHFNTKLGYVVLVTANMYKVMTYENQWKMYT